MSKHSVLLIGGEDGEMATIEASSPGRDKCALTITYRGKTVQAESLDYFEALLEVRKLMEQDHLIPFCYGASLNVYPSGMSRDMSQGMVAYRMTLGRSTTREDLVRIFDAGADVIPAFVAQQKEYFDEWKNSFPV
jgi:hypothetical protein